VRVVAPHDVARAVGHDGQVRHRVDDPRHQLDRRAGRPDHPDPPAGQVVAVLAPGRRAQHGSRGEGGDVGRRLPRRPSGARDQRPGVHRRAPVGAHRPALPVVGRAGDRRRELDVAAQPEPVGGEAEPALHLVPGGVALAPAPLAEERLGERVLVQVALGVQPRAGVGVPPPRPADVARRVVGPHAQALLPQQVQHREAAEAGADDDGVVLGPDGHALNTSTPVRRGQRRDARRRGQADRRRNTSTVVIARTTVPTVSTTSVVGARS
jgi:hypothetical protein